MDDYYKPNLPIDLYFDCSQITLDMRDWLVSCGATIRVKEDQPKTVEVSFAGGRTSHMYAGSSQIRIFFAHQDYQTALLFLLKYQSMIYRHNLPENVHEHTN